jgi:hypothetical protein
MRAVVLRPVIVYANPRWSQDFLRKLFDYLRRFAFDSDVVATFHLRHLLKCLQTSSGSKSTVPRSRFGFPDVVQEWF